MHTPSKLVAEPITAIYAHTQQVAVPIAGCNGHRWLILKFYRSPKMVFWGGFMLLLLLLLIVWFGTVTMSRADNFNYGVAAFVIVVCFDVDSLRARGVLACNGQVGDCIKDEELILDSVIPYL